MPGYASVCEGVGGLRYINGGRPCMCTTKGHVHIHTSFCIQEISCLQGYIDVSASASLVPGNSFSLFLTTVLSCRSYSLVQYVVYVTVLVVVPRAVFEQRPSCELRGNAYMPAQLVVIQAYMSV